MQLSQSPGLYCKLEVKLGVNSFKFETGNSGKFPGKRKSPSDYRRDQKRKKPPGKEMPIPGNPGVCSAAPGGPTRAQKGVTSRAPPSSPLCSRAVPWSKHLFSPSNIPQLDGAESFSSEKELYIQASTPTVAPLGQHEGQCSQLPPFARIQPTLPPTHAQPVNNKPVSSSPLSQTQTKQIQSTQTWPHYNLSTYHQYQPSLRKMSLNQINKILNQMSRSLNKNNKSPNKINKRLNQILKKCVHSLAHFMHALSAR